MSSLQERRLDFQIRLYRHLEEILAEGSGIFAEPDDSGLLIGKACLFSSPRSLFSVVFLSLSKD